MQIAGFDSQLINNCMQIFLPARGRRRFRIKLQQPIFFFCNASTILSGVSRTMAAERAAPGRADQNKS